MADLKYLELLSKHFPTVQAASAEIINLEAILKLPKGTEHFVSDLHGEYQGFQHVLRNASGVVQRKISEVFGDTLEHQEKRDLCTLICYPEQKLKMTPKDDEWYRETLNRLCAMLNEASSKYTRSKVRKALPSEYAYIIEELLHQSDGVDARRRYYETIFNSIISTGEADNFICQMAEVIKRLLIDTLHVIGDIFDRGPGAHKILDLLCNYHNVDVQWGNHDLVWMGAAAGNGACIANVVRNSLCYANMETLENGYGINLIPLMTFAMETYGDDPCTQFLPRVEGAEDSRQMQLMAKMHKAIAIMQFKLEGQIIHNHPEFRMESRDLMSRIDLERGSVRIERKWYKLNDTNFPTFDPANPTALSAGEQEVMDGLSFSFRHSKLLAKHMRFLYTNGAFYLVRNGNLIFHGSMPLKEDGSLKELTVMGHRYKGKALFDKIDQVVRLGYYGEKGSAEKAYGVDYMWFLWGGSYAPPFDKDKMTTFERLFVDDKTTHVEHKGYYQDLKNDKAVCEMILKEFGLEGEHTHIINGHVPVKKGESPIRAEGKLLVIDGGFSKPYQATTGIAGYTLIYNSHGMLIAEHKHFYSVDRALQEGSDIKSFQSVVEHLEHRTRVADIDDGKVISAQVEDLRKLLDAYRQGAIREKK